MPVLSISLILCPELAEVTPDFRNAFLLHDIMEVIALEEPVKTQNTFSKNNFLRLVFSKSLSQLFFEFFL